MKLPLVGSFLFTMIEFIIVGGGLAGIAFADVLEREGKMYKIIDNHSQQSSKVAAGIYNPVMLKRLAPIDTAPEQLVAMHRFYDRIENRLDHKFLFPKQIFRRLSSVEESNNWFARSDNPDLSAFMSGNILPNEFEKVSVEFGFGIINSTGYVDTEKLLREHKNYLIGSGKGIFEDFEYDNFNYSHENVQYKDLVAKHIVFCEGFGLKNNPLFNYLPLDGTKGELLIVESQDLDIDVIISAGIFIIPLGNNIFKVGATYNWRDKSVEITEHGRIELTEKLESLIDCDFKILEHLAAIRPTVKDRKPLVGTHPNYNNCHILNGLGSRGVMLAPLYAQKLYDSIENRIPLPKSIDIVRFSSRH